MVNSLPHIRLKWVSEVKLLHTELFVHEYRLALDESDVIRKLGNVQVQYLWFEDVFIAWSLLLTGIFRFFLEK